MDPHKEFGPREVHILWGVHLLKFNVKANCIYVVVVFVVEDVIKVFETGIVL